MVAANVIYSRENRMLELSKLTINNFLSYKHAELKLDNLGCCLIRGEIESDLDDVEFDKISNGSGKSSIVNAISWCLFGRTMHKHNPGDNVINWDAGKDCYVDIIFKDGSSLRRTRKLNSKNEIIYKNQSGDDVSLGTNKMQQKQLESLLGLDWEIFCGSCWFPQYGTSWMEMSDAKRREALEREFKLDRVRLYAESAADKIKKIESEQSIIKRDIDSNNSRLDSLASQKERLIELSDKFDQNRSNKIKNLQSQIDDLNKDIKKVKFVSVEDYISKWNKYNAVSEKLSVLFDKLSEDRGSIISLNSQIKRNQAIVDKWEGKGKICSSCQQPISEEYLSAKTKTDRDSLAELKEDKRRIESEIEKYKPKLDKAKLLLDQNQPDMSVRDAKKHNKRQEDYVESIKKSIAQKLDDIENEKNSVNSYKNNIDDINKEISNIKSDVADLQTKNKKFNMLLNHLSYIRKAYSDRRKIKSFLLKRYVPYLNDRINHYLKKLDFDLGLTFTNALGISSGKWDYTFYSGGERKRVDLAIMLAMFDLHKVMYGRYCNIVVFDEVDARLDPGGAELFSEILKNDLAQNVDSVLIISQRDDMKGRFESEIRVVRKDRVSEIASIST